jgi:hypothetical protein
MLLEASERLLKASAMSEQARDALGQAQGDVEANADEACGKARVGAGAGIDRLALAAGNKFMYQSMNK